MHYSSSRGPLLTFVAKNGRMRSEGHMHCCAQVRERIKRN